MEHGKEPRQVMMIQQGARRDYIYARQLEEAGLLHSLVCDAAWAGESGKWSKNIAKCLSPRILGSVERRTITGIGPERIKTSVLPNLASIFKLVSDQEQTLKLIDEVLALRLRMWGLRGAEVVVNYFGNGGSFLDYAKRQGARIVTDFISNPRYWEVVQAERESWPGWETGKSVASNMKVYRERLERLVGISDIYLCPSRSVANDLAGVAAFDGRRVRIVPYGYSGGKLLPAIPNIGRVLFAASLITVTKGLPYLAVAARKLKTIRPEIEIVVAGAVAPAVRMLPETKDLVFLGKLNKQQMAEEFARADVFCLPSLSEGSPTSIFEAMANGVPIITTGSSGSIVEDGIEGFIVPERDGDALAFAITRLAFDRDLRERMSAAARDAANRYSAEACGAKFISVIRELL
jgi:glycosyltransferase involved in cell wall biosynthesis